MAWSVHCKLSLLFRKHMVTCTTHHCDVIEQMAFMYEIATWVGLRALCQDKSCQTD